MRRALWVSLLVAAQLVPLGCRRAGEKTHRNGNVHPADGGDEGTPAAAESKNGELPHLELAQIRGVRFESVGEPRQEGAWFAAEAVADLSASATFSAPVAGILTRLRAEPGQAVRSGSPLAEIRSPELARLKAAWLAARFRAIQANREAERERRLLAVEATSQRDLEAAESLAAMAEAEEQAAGLELRARGVDPAEAGAVLVVRAPRAGILTGFDVPLGAGVESGRSLGRIVAPGTALVQVELPLPGPVAWSPGAVTEARRADGRRWAARVEGIPAALSSETRRLTYRLRLQGSELPLAGTPLEARVPLDLAIVLPQSSLQQIEGEWGVFVAEGEEAHFRPVRKGAELGGDVLVLEGLHPGERVATEGAYLLKSLLLKQSGGGDEHDH
jgi:cobalt-zinc-cadmium efflux system membrane fusion protein